MDLASAADELYGAPLAEFVTARTRLEKQARAAGDRQLAAEIRALRKASQAAWAVNQLVRRDPDLLDEVLRLGDDLRAAQDAGDSAGLRRLTTRRHELYTRLRTRAEEFVVADGRRLGAAAAQALEDSVGAALADPRAADVLRSGRLVADLESSGWGPVDLSGAQAVIDTGQASPDTAASGDADAPVRGSRDDTSEARAALALAHDAAAKAAVGLERAQEVLDASTAEQQRLATRKAALVDELRALEEGERRAAQDVVSARTTRDDAAREAERASRSVRQVARRVDRSGGRG